MRIAIVAVALALAACGSGKPVEPVLAEDRVVLANFTADVDLDAGTVVIRTVPSVARSSSRSGDEAHLVSLDASVTVANAAGSVWVNGATACPDASAGPTWGSDVTVKNNLSGTYLSGVYAEITSFGGSLVALGSCSNSVAPTGMSAANGGLWSYGLIAPGESKSTTSFPAAKWVFKYGTATKFSFSGRIVGVKVDPANMEGATQRSVSNGQVLPNVIAANPTTVYASTGTGNGIDLVNSTTGAFTRNVATGAKVTAIAVAPGRVWWGSEAQSSTTFLLGFMDLDGTSTGSVTMTTGTVAPTAAVIDALIPDPVTPDTKVWIVYYDQVGGNAQTWVRSYTIGGTFGTAVSTAGGAYHAARYANTIYMPDYANTGYFMNTADIISDPPTTSLFYGGAFLFAIARGLDGNLYYNDGATVYRTTDFNSPTAVGVSAINAYWGGDMYSIAASATGEVWVTGSNARVARVDAGTSYVVTLPPTTQSANATALSNGFLWVTTNDGKLWRVTIQ
jgi:hypothetical protein